MVLLECKDFKESLVKLSIWGHFQEQGESKIPFSYPAKELFQLIMRWSHGYADVQFYAKDGVPVLLMVKSLANLALILMTAGSDLAI